MDKIILAEDLYSRKHFEDDDFIDRLNSRYTVMILIMCIFIITGQIYVGDSINCWTPAQFSDTHNSYTNSICWLKGSYYLPSEEITIPDRSKPRLYHVSYYQWTPFILLGMAILFLFPHLLWQAFSRQSGLDIQRLVQTIKSQSDSEESITLVKRSLKAHLDRQITLYGTICCCCRCKNFYFGYTLTYFSVKLLYITNTISQFFLLNSFLSFHFTVYGVEALKKLFSNEDWFDSPRFPRITMCDFMIRQLGSNQHWYAVQCNLPINMYNEKIFLGVWIWLIVLTILNILSIFPWIISLTKGRRLASIKKYLGIIRYLPSNKGKEGLLLSTTSSIGSMNSDKNFNEFTDYLHIDGFLIFRIIAHNTNELIAGEIIEYLYRNYERPVRNDLNNV